MEIIQGTKPIDKIIAANPGKKIGKYGINYDKAIDTKVLLHDGHKDCINQLRIAGMDIVILEFFNTTYAFPSWNVSLKTPIEQLKVLDNCISENLNVDYIVYDSDDFKISTDPSIIQLVDDRLKIEDYKNKLKIPDNVYTMFREILIFITKRNSSNITHSRSYKTGVDSFAIKHYFNKYMNCDLLIIHPTMFDNTFYPLDFTTNINDEIYDNIKIFLNYFHTISKDEIINNPDKVKIDIEKYATDMGYYIEDFTIIDDPVFIGVDKIFISMNVKGGLYNSRFPIYKWL